MLIFSNLASKVFSVFFNCSNVLGNGARPLPVNSSVFGSSVNPNSFCAFSNKSFFTPCAFSNKTFFTSSPNFARVFFPNVNLSQASADASLCLLFCAFCASVKANQSLIPAPSISSFFPINVSPNFSNSAG